MWLDSSEGYCLSYYGMIVPQVSAIASIERDSVANFGFFFLFPFTTSNREDMNRRQAEFCGCLLQEMKDIGMTLAVISGSDSLFELAGDYMGNYVTVRLTDERVPERRAADTFSVFMWSLTALPLPMTLPPFE